MDDNPDLDEFDHRILSVLATDGRISMTALGEQVGLSKSPVTMRVKRLEEMGVITGYRAELSPSKLQLEHVAFLQIKLKDTREQALAQFNAGIRKIAEIESCHMIAGSFDYLVKVRTRDIAAYRTVLGEKISQLPHLESTSTFVSMESVLDHGVRAL